MNTLVSGLAAILAVIVLIYVISSIKILHENVSGLLPAAGPAAPSDPSPPQRDASATAY